MASLLKCLLRACFEDTPEIESENTDGDFLPSRSGRMIRLFHSTTTSTRNPSSTSYRGAAAHDLVLNDNGDCCRTHDASEGTTTTTSASVITSSSTAASATTTSIMSESNPHAASLRQFWRVFRERLNLDGGDAAADNTTLVDAEKQQQQRDERIPILTQASSFDSSKEVPTIQTEHIVMPGSELQRQMALAMVAHLEDQDEECVICMEGFDPTNPRMPTLCGCGENKTYFHLPCLYQWIEQSRECPSCRKHLRWEEF